MNLYKTYLISLGMFYYMFIFPVIRCIWYLVAVAVAVVVYLLIVMFILNILFTIAITSSISFGSALIMLFIAILSLFGGVLWSSGVLNHSIYKGR